MYLIARNLNAHKLHIIQYTAIPSCVKLLWLYKYSMMTIVKYRYKNLWSFFPPINKNRRSTTNKRCTSNFKKGIHYKDFWSLIHQAQISARLICFIDPRQGWSGGYTSPPHYKLHVIYTKKVHFGGKKGLFENQIKF